VEWNTGEVGSFTLSHDGLRELPSCLLSTASLAGAFCNSEVECWLQDISFITLTPCMKKTIPHDFRLQSQVQIGPALVG
jgi:hypothetical protein